MGKVVNLVEEFAGNDSLVSVSWWRHPPLPVGDPGDGKIFWHMIQLVELVVQHMRPGIVDLGEGKEGHAYLVQL